MRTFISEYYKRLFGPPAPNNVTLDESFRTDLPQISTEENDILTLNFTKKEVLEAINQMEHNKSPGPDGFPA